MIPRGIKCKRCGTTWGSAYFDSQMCEGCHRELNAQKKEPPSAEADRGDVVTRPKHYALGGIECIEAMEAATANATDLSPMRGYLWMNAFKYLWRWPYKNGLEDLKKCRWYIDRLITQLESESS